MTLVEFRELAGVPCEYTGLPGDRGRPGTRKLEAAFLARLEVAIADLQSLCPPLEAIVSAGAFVPREPTPGDRHATGTAFDLVALRFAGARALVAELAPQDARRYLGTEAVLRRHVPQVLGWWTNEAHRSHWHLDDRSAAAGFSRGSPADVSFVQACCSHVFGRQAAIDGRWGPQTDAAVRAVLGELVAPGLDVPDGWRAWLEAVALVGWGRVEAKGAGWSTSSPGSLSA